jgi:hypothetical protein
MTAAMRLSRDGDPVMDAAGVFAGEVGIGAFGRLSSVILMANIRPNQNCAGS